MDPRELLSAPAASVKKPPSWPAGQYYGFLEKYEQIESREKKTPGIRVFVKVQRADESIPQNMLLDSEGKPLDFSKRQFRKDYYITPDSLWRLTSMLEAVGIDLEGKSIAACLPELNGKPVAITMGVRASENGQELFNEVGDLKAIQA